MSVLLWENLSVLNWLDSGVVMILVDLSVNGFCCLLMSVRLDGLGGDGWVDNLVNVSGVAVTAGDLGDGGSCGVHCECVDWNLRGKI